MSKHRCFLVEIGTEELPPRALPALSAAFAAGMREGLAEGGLEHGELAEYATPRRLALRLQDVALRQPDREIRRQGPPARVAVAADGTPTRAGIKFAESCGVAFEGLEQIETDKGRYLFHRGIEPGRDAAELLPGIVEAALAGLPVPRRMRWGANEFEFVRPVHWLVMLLGEEVLDAELYGIAAGRETRGHRFHAPGPIRLDAADRYPGALESEGYVVADFGARRGRVEAAVRSRAAELGGRAVYDTALLDEVTALVEWPVALDGRFDPRFLDLPREVLVSTLQAHQRYFPIEGPEGGLLPRFVAVSNLESRDPDQVRAGNERVVLPRLADAAFFWDADLATGFERWREELDRVVFQDRLGTLADRTRRLMTLARGLAAATGADPDTAEAAAAVAKCDLMSQMVGEFPDLQGVMGRYYHARLHPGHPGVAVAIEEQYLPRRAGDALPATATGRALALAEKLDGLAGIFSIGQKPTGTRDPFGLRRAALGVLRILVEDGIELDLRRALEDAARLQPGVTDAAGLSEGLFDYMMERLRAYYIDGAGPLRAPPEMVEAVLARRPISPLDVHRRLEAVLEFADLPAAASLAAANKRVANILRQAGGAEAGEVQPALLEAPAERALYQAVEDLRPRVEARLAEGDYRRALEILATLREPVDAFFDEVMVMAEDEHLRRNRLALLGRMRALFLYTADLSRLST